MALSLNRSKGSLLGLAVGDALGTTLEFMDRRHPPNYHRDMTGGGVFVLPPGCWTDDTAMALALADSLITRGRFDPIDQLERYVRWWNQGDYSSIGRCFDIGNITIDALRHFEETGAGPASWTGRGAGNGSLMRLVPVVIAYASDDRAAREYAGRSSLTTHPHPWCYCACRLFGGMLCRALGGGSKEEVLSVREGFYGEVESRLDRAPKRLRSQLRSTGFVLDSLECAIWAFATTESFEEALIEAVNLGGDADTIGAITGQLAGAFYGLEAIPDRWLAPLHWRRKIETMAEQLTRSIPE